MWGKVLHQLDGCLHVDTGFIKPFFPFPNESMVEEAAIEPGCRDIAEGGVRPLGQMLQGLPTKELSSLPLLFLSPLEFQLLLTGAPLPIPALRLTLVPTAGESFPLPLYNTGWAPCVSRSGEAISFDLQLPNGFLHGFFLQLLPHPPRPWEIKNNGPDTCFLETPKSCQPTP